MMERIALFGPRNETFTTLYKINTNTAVSYIACMNWKSADCRFPLRFSRKSFKLTLIHVQHEIEVFNERKNGIRILTIGRWPPRCKLISKRSRGRIRKCRYPQRNSLQVYVRWKVWLLSTGEGTENANRGCIKSILQDKFHSHSRTLQQPRGTIYPNCDSQFNDEVQSQNGSHDFAFPVNCINPKESIPVISISRKKNVIVLFTTLTLVLVQCPERLSIQDRWHKERTQRNVRICDI